MKTILKTVMLAIAMLATSPAMAAYTECAAIKDTRLSIRPNGPTEPRYALVAKGHKVAFRGRYAGWWFVMHYAEQEDSTDYGWIPQNVLTDCKEREGTP